MSRLFQSALVGSAAGLILWAPSLAQAQAVDRIQVSPASMQIEQGHTASFEVRALDAQGNPVDAELRFVGIGPVQVDGEGHTVTGTQGGATGRVVVAAVVPADFEGDVPSAEILVEVTFPALARLEVEAPRAHAYAGTAMTLQARAFHADGSERPEPGVTWSSADPEVARVDRFGQVSALSPGTTTVRASAEGVETAHEVAVRAFPGVRMELEASAEEARTGDVITFTPRIVGEDGSVHEHLPVEWGYSFRPPDAREQRGATGLIEDGRFVAEAPGVYTVTATAGPLTARQAVEIEERHVVQEVRLEGQGRVANVHTSDLWVWEGVDGRDYAITGTWGADGYAYIWDITNPSNPVTTDSVQVDARTVNDVKVSPDGRYGIMTREGASSRRNGLVILDLSEPAHPVIAAIHEEGLTGGVHNAFPAEDHVYALSAGQKYLIIDVQDIYNPRTVGEVEHEGCRIHDVWVLDGLAYSAQWGCGIIVYDVGNGAWGGTPESPVFVSQLTTPGGRTHAVFPYHQESTGRHLVFAGDEILNRRGRPLQGGLSRDPYDPVTGEGGLPSNTAGYVHVLDFTDMENPRKVARYEVPEYGTHNIWVEDDVLYQGYYEGGTRVVDVSGELMGNLATQGREIAVYKSHDPAGFIANAPMVWSAMPFKGRIFFSDWNSGLWSIQLLPREPFTM